ncbi:hypothetical protein [Coxiella endosymbiont of Ornithodoros amblus]|uniref:hypothetical protein n=1 Tax=Coxiella endosymbiont of Ornithodoros amblus TaxID=1656166 RepID=UPI00244E0AC9|nr:hypothetical protein [Coxiella endosymbiont of Ornithodoros amblus]
MGDRDSLPSVVSDEGGRGEEALAREKMAASSVRILLGKLGLFLANVLKEGVINLNQNPFITMPKVVVDSPSEVSVVEPLN